MKKTFLRILISASLFSLVSGVVVMIIGFVLGWKTATQFSDGFFWAGALVLLIGCVNALGTVYHSGLEFRQSAVYLDAAERFKLKEADILHGYNLLAFLGISGLLLFGLSALAILVGRLF